MVLKILNGTWKLIDEKVNLKKHARNGTEKVACYD